VKWANDACRQFDAELLDYLEGESRPHVAEHAAECPYCAARLGDLLLIRTSAGDLEAAEPPARLWANVRAGLAAEGLIRERRERGWWSWALRPAPALALAGLVLLGFVFAWSSGLLRRGSRVTSAAVVLVDPALANRMDKMEQAFRERAALLDPNVKAAYEKGLSSLDAEIQECNDSLTRQPDDALAREYLASAYTEKARVLASAMELGEGNDR